MAESLWRRLWSRRRLASRANQRRTDEGGEIEEMPTWPGGTERADGRGTPVRPCLLHVGTKEGERASEGEAESVANAKLAPSGQQMWETHEATKAGGVPG